MCMPTNFGIRKKYILKVKRDKKIRQKKDNFFDNADDFLKVKNENISIKS